MIVYIGSNPMKHLNPLTIIGILYCILGAPDITTPHGATVLPTQKQGALFGTSLAPYPKTISHLRDIKGSSEAICVFSLQENTYLR